MKILITGANSFVGKALIRGVSGNESLEVIATYRNKVEFLGHDKVSYLKLDLCDESSFAALPENNNVIFHIASQSVVLSDGEDALIKNNVESIKNLIKYAQKAGTKKIVFASSISALGDIQTNLVDENAKSINPKGYGLSKFLCEKELEKVKDEIPSVCIRLPGVIGKESHRNWLSTILQKVKKNDSFSIKNPDAEFNNLVHVDDLSGFIISLMNKNWKGCHKFPIASLEPLKIKEIVDIIIKKTSSNSEYDVAPSDDNSFLISSDYAISNFDYKPDDTKSSIIKFVQENL
jgi:nucleoside-diphosphate-sugar epimerase